MKNLDDKISTLTHKLNQPLSTISLAATSLQIQKEMGILTDEFFYDATNKILSNIEELSNSIDEFKNSCKKN